ncbi:hypothetical protein Pelo_1114 [Pelomyxa schiedti]|nr:hypothetical protein Pelo_1114 [Pelomyxa schiedti]
MRISLNPRAASKEHNTALSDQPLKKQLFYTFVPNDAFASSPFSRFFHDHNTIAAVLKAPQGDNYVYFTTFFPPVLIPFRDIKPQKLGDMGSCRHYDCATNIISPTEKPEGTIGISCL